MPEGLEPPSGRQFELVHGSAVAVVTEVGGGIRTFEVDGDPVLFGYEADALCSGGRGQVLAPWPNRLADGSYRWLGVEGAAAWDEPERRNAIHGLVRWLRWRGEQHSRSAVTMSTRIEPQPGYPWRVELAVRYELGTGTGSQTEDGGGAGSAALTLEVTASNRSATAAPFGIGFHPYVFAGELLADSCEMELAASTRLLTDERGLPVGTTDVRGTEYDFSSPRRVGTTRLDDCLTGLAGPWRARVTRADGRFVTVAAGAEFPFSMVFTADTLAGDDRRRGIAIEPMTCPPNALVSGEGLIVLEAAGATTWRGRVEIATGR